MKFGLFLSTFDNFSNPQIVQNFARMAEELGFDGVFLPDHLHSGNRITGALDPWMMLSLIAGKTERIQLGTWITAVPRRQPWQLARDVATLDQISGGRAILGAGLGAPPEDYTDYGREYNLKELGQQFDEALEVINGLWQEGKFSFEGSYYTIDEVDLYPKPVQQPRVPILVAGRWPAKKPIRRGVSWDGIMPIGGNFPEPLTEDELRDLVSYYQSQGGTGEIVISNHAEIEGMTDHISLCREIGITWILLPVVPQLGTVEENKSRIREIAKIIKKYRE